MDNMRTDRTTAHRAEGDNERDIIYREKAVLQYSNTRNSDPLSFIQSKLEGNETEE